MGLSVVPDDVEDLFINHGYPVMLEKYNAVPYFGDQFATVTTAPFDSLAASFGDFPYGLTYSEILGMDQPREVEFGQELPADTMVDGYNPQAKVRKFGRSVTFTKEDFRARNAMSNIGDKLTMLGAAWGRAFIEWENRLLASYLQRGTIAAGDATVFKNRYQGRNSVTDGLIYDGKAWFAADHPQDDGSSTTYSNIITSAALSTTTLQDAMIRAQVTNAFDGRGNRILIQPDVLIVPAGLQYTAADILESEHPAGSALTSTNTVRGALRRVVFPYLTDDADAWWVGTSTSGLRVIRTGAPTPEVVVDAKSGTVTVQVEAYTAVLVDQWRGWVANNKATS